MITASTLCSHSAISARRRARSEVLVAVAPLGERFDFLRNELFQGPAHFGRAGHHRDAFGLNLSSIAPSNSSSSASRPGSVTTMASNP
ncbi:hypothetical protein [Bifidobacterium crudilactis]|uniref:hypothetical protein n=1 Tax=Bifidobacterium crudilactis TaxID=327277 RepID=UPI0026490643|nr:hypothetical protein [Bifidobacterium crudilactis]MDN5972958.1 hypothetical protein [Bifidobacterium crudilactis]MDN6210166.1 hypothetical protein [Bifidobacterium crudilactis]MDN6458947.1 hypothetical protein [Bifidobacterium crudilactis]MDN6467097.1 hypothetical protein [Bifidobacterium crudilactis]MDN6559518.1 hypothetical protein [Bifidobacterium crudilactis]